MLLREGSFVIEDIPVAKIKVFIHREREKTGKAELTDSIRKHGLIIPVTVVLKHSGDHEAHQGRGAAAGPSGAGGRYDSEHFAVPEDKIDPNEKTVEWLVENSVREKAASNAESPTVRLRQATRHVL